MIPINYTIVSGEHLAQVAADNDLTVAEFLALNPELKLEPGVDLHVGFTSPEPDPEPGPGDTLQDAAARHDMKMGAAVADHLFNSDAAKTVLAREYNVLTAENVMKFGNIHPQADTYNWAAADRLVNFAQANGQDVHGHALLWHIEMPSWANSSHLEDHINTIVGRYKGKVQSWDVVNEVLNEDGSLRDVWYKDLVAQAFHLAHAADPDAKLYINDFNIETDRVKSDAMYAFVQQLLADGVPVHGVGFQCHFNTEWTPAGELEVNLKRFKALGLEVAVTEFDCALKNGGTLSQQASAYRNMINAALDAKADKFITWGFTDASTWLPGQDPLPFEDNYGKKPAYDAMLDALNEGAVIPDPDPDPDPEPTITAAQIRAHASGGSNESPGVYQEGHSEGSVRVMKKGDALYWHSGMSIDCDGQPGSLCNINTDPWFQAQTAYQQSNGEHLNAEDLPFVVIPLSSSIWNYNDSDVDGGDLCVMTYQDKIVYGVVGDLGPAQRIGEGSYAAADALGINPDPRYGGIGSGVTYVLFPGTRVNPIESKSEAVRLGKQKIAEWLGQTPDPDPDPDPDPEVPEKLSRALAWARAQVGKPYVLGAFGSSLDCSTYMSGIATMIRDGEATRWFTTHPFHSGSFEPLAGWERGLEAPFMIGIQDSGVGHTGGTLMGIDFEATAADGRIVRSSEMDSRTRGAKHPYYDRFYGFRPSLVEGGTPDPDPVDTGPEHNYTRVTWGGRTINVRTREMLEAAIDKYGSSFSLTQGSYNAGGVSASAGTHDGGGVVDIPSSSNALLKALREVGFAAWVRSPAEGFAYHIHAVAIGDQEMSNSAADQVDDYFAGRNGLANNGPDSAPSSVGRPYPEWAEYYRDGGQPPTNGDPYQYGLPSPGSESPSAIPLQQKLKQHGYMPSSVQEHPNYGPATEAGVIAFHRANPQFTSVDPDPVIGPMGWAHLRSM